MSLGSVSLPVPGSFEMGRAGVVEVALVHPILDCRADSLRLDARELWEISFQ